MFTDVITIPRRFNGPPQSGNGGYVCGRLAAFLPGEGAAVVRLHVPPPLERSLTVEADDDAARLLDGDTLVAQARRTGLDLAPPPAPTFEQAQAASRSYAGFVRHPLPTCFVCGPRRTEGDGLRIFAGPTAGDPAVLAAPWVVHPSLADAAGRVPAEFLWAALDCAGAFAVMPRQGGLFLLGELTARLDGDVEVGEPCVVVAWALGRDGRKHRAGTAVYGGSGALRAVARATWIELASDGGPPAAGAAG